MLNRTKIAHNTGDTYMFRAEFPKDVESFFRLLPQDELVEAVIKEGCLKIEHELHPIPDRHVVIKVKSLKLEALRDILRKIEDGHVMLQTIMPIAQYEGLRNYDLY